jgi:hypothetical protein
MDKGEVTGGIAWLCLAAAVGWMSLKLGIGEFRNPGSGFVPFLGSLVLALFACLLIAGGVRRKGPSPTAPRWQGRRWGLNLAVAAALILYSLLLVKLGYILATLGLMAVLLGLGRMRPGAVIVGSLLAVLLTYGLFHGVLKVPLPSGLLAF